MTSVRSTMGRPISLRSIVAADLQAMAEGEFLSRRRIAARMAVHARWRAVALTRVAQGCFRSRWAKPVGLWLGDRVLAFSGAEIQPKCTIGPGLVLKHTTGLVIGGDVVAGERLTVHQNVTLGDRRPFGGQPVLGDDVTIGAGACVLGPITIGDRVVVAANAVVLHDVPDDAVVAGAPARPVGRTPVDEVRVG